jgi:hypothetical protein
MELSSLLISKHHVFAVSKVSDRCIPIHLVLPLFPHSGWGADPNEQNSRGLGITPENMLYALWNITTGLEEAEKIKSLIEILHSSLASLPANLFKKNEGGSCIGETRHIEGIMGCMSPALGRISSEGCYLTLIASFKPTQ